VRFAGRRRQDVLYIGPRRGRGADVGTSLLGQEPAVLEDLVEHLGGGQPVRQLPRHHGQHLVEDLGAPAVRGHRLRERSALLLLQVTAEGDDVVEHPAGLVLGRPQSGPGEQLVPVPAALGDLGVHAQPGARLRRDQLQLVDVEPQLVQPVDPLGDR
jgi:hypothetical protein